jgi:Ca2+-binding RTX toxin-like protein
MLFLGLVAVTVVMIVAADTINNLGTMTEQTNAKNAVLDLSAAAKEVFSQGDGARKQVYIVLPESYEPNESYVQNRAIKLRAKGTDYVAIEDFDMHGELPGRSGAHWIWVISEGSRVRIGNAMLSTDRNSIYVIMNRDSTAAESFSVTNIANETVTVSKTVVWTVTNVTMGVSPAGGFLLNPDESQDIDLSFTSSADAVGYYSGYISFTATDGTDNETIDVPITVEVVGAEDSGLEPLTVTPDFWGEAMGAGESVNKTFTVCTGNNTAVTDVTFTPSAGSPGDWVSNTSALGAMAGGTCQQKTMTLTVPNGTMEAGYNGSIQVVGGGAIDAEDTISVYIVVDEGISSCSANQSAWGNCPVGSDYWGIPTCNCQRATIYVLGGIIYGGPDDGLPFNGTLRGGAGGDVIAGTNDADIIYTSTGGDMICGHGGDDIIYGDNSGDIIDGGDGNDMIYGNGSGDIIYGKGGDDTIYGHQGDDEIDGGEGMDLIYGDDGKDLIYGGPDDDEIYGGDSLDTICGNAGIDTLDGEVGNDVVDGGTGADTINGGLNNDDCYRGSSYTSCENQLPGSYLDCGPS